jgi:ACS family hexuronate transporter-like MFS transporter
MLGLFWTALWVKLATDLPRKNPAEEVELIEKGQIISTDVVEKQSLLYYLKQSIILSVIVVFCATNYITYVFLTWFSSYLVMAHNLSIKNMSIVRIIPWLLRLRAVASAPLP